MKDKEIELKFVIDKNTRSKILADLNKKAKKIYEGRVIDTYYIPYFKEYEVDGKTNECLRIREHDGKNVLTYKFIHRDCSPVYCDEYETMIENKEQMEKILFSIGFKIQMIIDKTRTTYVKDNLEFDFDSVKNLGELLEVEIKNDSGTINDICAYTSQFGLTMKDANFEGIQVLMKKSMGNGH